MDDAPSAADMEPFPELFDETVDADYGLFSYESIVAGGVAAGKATLPTLTTGSDWPAWIDEDVSILVDQSADPIGQAISSPGFATGESSTCAPIETSWSGDETERERARCPTVDATTAGLLRLAEPRNNLCLEEPGYDLLSSSAPAIRGAFLENIPIVVRPSLTTTKSLQDDWSNRLQSPQSLSRRTSSASLMSASSENSLGSSTNTGGCGYTSDASSTSHRSEQSRKRFPKIEGAYVCNTCSKAFDRAGDLTKHAKRHGPPEYGCDTCIVGFIDKKDLRRHRRSTAHKKAVARMTGAGDPQHISDLADNKIPSIFVDDVDVDNLG